jgi:protoporphyrinogen oxidase
VWGIDPGLLDPRTASSRIAFNSVFDYVIQALRFYVLHQSDFRSIHSPLKDGFYYPRRGVGTLTQRLADRCAQAGVEVRLGQVLVRLESDGERITGLLFSGGAVEHGFDYVVSTIPLTQLLAALGYDYGHPLIGFRSMVFVFLEVPQPQVTPYSWLYVPDEDICFQRLTEFSHLRAGMEPPGSTGLAIELSCFAGDAVWVTPDDELVARVRRDMARTGLLGQEVPARAHVVRRSFVYPVQVNGYLEMVDQMLTPVRMLRNAVSVGRQGLFKYCNMNECMEMAIEAAARITAGADSFAYSLDSGWRGARLEGDRVLTGTGDARTGGVDT